MTTTALLNGLAVFSAFSLQAFGGTIIDASESVPPLKRPFISGDIGVSASSQYIARGLILENRGVVLQPYANIAALLYDGSGFLERFSLRAGIWNDINPSAPIAAPHGTNEAWTELLWQAGFEVQFARRFSLRSAYRQYTSPSDAYRLGRAIESVLSFDDSGLFSESFRIHPKLTVLYELPAPGHNGLRGHSWYFEPSISPSYTFLAGTATPVTFGVPITVGLGSGFYAGKTFGYLSLGPQVTVPLSFVPTKYGTWIFSASYSCYLLGSSTRAFAPDHESRQSLFSASMELKF